MHGAYINGLNRLEIVQIEDMQCLNIHKGLFIKVKRSTVSG